MNFVGIITFLSLSLLFMSLLLIYSKFHNKTLGKLLMIIIFFLFNALPLVYIVYMEQRFPFRSKTINLGSAFLFVWLITACSLFFGILFRFRVKKEDSYY